MFFILAYFQLYVNNNRCKHEYIIWHVSHMFFDKCDGNAAAAAAKSFQSCLTLCDPIDGSPPGSALPTSTYILGLI